MLTTKVVQLLKEHLPLPEDKIKEMLEIPPNPKMGDLAFPCFTLAKELRKAPPIIAQELADKLSSEIVKAVPTGPYLNFYFDHAALAEEIIAVVAEDGFGEQNIGQGKRVIIEMSSPNIAKPFGIGHLRSTMIGNALYHLYKTLGYDAIRINHLGDWGTQFGKQIVAYKKWGDADKIAVDPIQEFLNIYVKFHEEAEAHPELEDEARMWFKKLEDGDSEARALWQYFIDESLKEFKRMYEKLGVEFDHYMGESFYSDKMSAVVAALKEKGLLEESDGAQVVRLDEEDMPPCIILKSDGSTIYATRDLATAIYRHDQLHAEEIIYVVGAEQSLHFRQVYSVLKKMGHEWAAGCEHVAFGLMKFEGRKLSTRRGHVIFLEEVLDEAVERARQIIEEKNPSLPDKEAVADAVGIGAIIFGDLKNTRIHEVNFSLDEALNFDGETGPYVQYTFARTQSVIERAGEQPTSTNISGNHIAGDEAWQLLKNLISYPEVLERALERNEPSVLARYLIELAKDYNRFYHHERILVDDAAERNTKLYLTALTGQILQKGLHILGIKTPSKI